MIAVMVVIVVAGVSVGGGGTLVGAVAIDVGAADVAIDVGMADSGAETGGF